MLLAVCVASLQFFQLSLMKNIILIIVSLAMFMEAVDTTIINTAIPAIAHSLSVDPIDLKLALISYLLSLAIFTPISGWVADKFGAKKVFITAIGIFTLSSIWCGLSHNLLALVIARSIQGFGGSLTLPVGRLIIVRTCERNELVSKMSVVVMIASLGLMLGPVLGGIITHNFTWRWIFFVNIPVGCIATILALYLLPKMPARTVQPLEKIDFILFGSGLALLTFGLSALSESAIQNSWAIITIIIAIAFLIFYAWRARNKVYPIVKTELLRYRTFRVSAMGNLISRIGFSSVPFLVPLLLQLVFVYSPQLSGLLLAPVALGVLLVKPLSFQILSYLGYKKLLIANTLLVALSLFSFSLITAQTSIYIIGCLTFLYGFLISLQYSAMNSLAYANISADEFSAATSIMSTLQQIAQSFAVAIAALLLRIFSANFSDRLLLSVRIFHHSFIALGIITLFSGLIFLYLKPSDGHEMFDRPILDDGK